MRAGIVLKYGLFVVLAVPLFSEADMEAISPQSDINQTRFWQEGAVEFEMGYARPSVLVGQSVELEELEYLRNVASQWNEVSNISYSIEFGCVHGDSASTDCGVIPDYSLNSRNQIHFDSTELGYPSDLLGTAERHTATVSPCHQTPGAGCLTTRIREANVFLNRSMVFGTLRDEGQCKPDAKTDYVEAVLLHEMGHALGLADIDGSVNIMYAEGYCKAKRLTDADKSALRDIYGPSDQVEVSILQPALQDLPVAPGNSLSLQAAFSARDSTLDRQLRDGSLSVEWSAEHGHLASGTSTTIQTEELLPGYQEIVAEAVDAQGNVLGSDQVSINLVTSIGTDEGHILHPLPCVELAGDPDGRCLMVVRESWISGQCQIGSWTHTVTLKDLIADRNFSGSSRFCVG